MVAMGQNLIKRELFPEISRHLAKSEITIITGARQVGKTTLLFQLKEQLLGQNVKAKDIHIFNLDILTNLEAFKDQHDFITFIKSRSTKTKIYVFVDEVQRLKNPGIFFKGIYDLKLPVKFVLTGSSSLEIKSKVQEPLTGRKRLFHLYPFSFSEFLLAKNKALLGVLEKREISSIDRRNILYLLDEYLIFGGYPQIVIEENHDEKIKLLNEIYSSYIEKDIVGFLKIKNSLSYSRLTSVLASQIGQLLNANELSRTLNLQVKTINHYLDYLQKTFIIQLLRPFYKNYRKEITKMPKMYFIDSGLRNSSLSAFLPMARRTDKGLLLENFILEELKDQKVKFWRTKTQSEVDFVLEHHNGNIIPLEVKAAKLKTPNIGRGLRSFINQYAPKRAYFINLGLRTKIKLSSTEIFFIHPYEVLPMTK